MTNFFDNLLKKIYQIMSSFIDKTNRGTFASIEAVWAAIPTGGNEGDYCYVDGVKYRWDKYNRMWINSEVYTETPARETTTFDGDVNVQNNLTVAGTIRAKGINNPCLGLFPTTSALEEKWPYPKVGWWAIIGDSIPGYISRCNTEGTWTHTSETGGGGEVDLTEYAKLTDIPEVVDNLTTDSGTKGLSARQGKVLNEKIPPVVDNLTSTSATSSLSAKQGKVLNEKIPTLVNDLITGGTTSALTAEQGKRLKDMIDTLSEISLHGIQDFVAISSLDALPTNPTEEQRKHAYLYESALYVYVGGGGDTLGGLYQSVQLVQVDWGDRGSDTYNSLGRTWLKTNIEDDANILTSAMISTVNMEYYIQYDYDLDGASITLPANSTLYFMGGSLKNGTLIGNNTRIVAPRGKVIFDDITIQGTWDVDTAWSSWFKTYKAGYKIASVVEKGATVYPGNDSQYYEFSELSSISNSYFVKSSLTDGTTVKTSSIFVPELTVGFYRGSDNESYAVGDLTTVNDVNFVKSTLGTGSSVIESSIFVVPNSTTVYKGTDKNYYTSEQVTLVDTTYYVTDTLVDGEVVDTSISTTAVTAYKGSNGRYYESSALQSVSSVYFVATTLDNNAITENSVFAVAVYKANNDSYYSFGKLVTVSSTYFVTDTLTNGSLNYNSVFVVPTVYSSFRIEGDDTDYVAAVQSVRGAFPYTSYNGVDFTTLDDTEALQSLLDLRAKKAVIEDGIYMFNARANNNGGYRTGLFYNNQISSELVIDGWLKVLPNGSSNFFAFDILCCQDVRISGKGGIQGDLLEHTGTNGEAGMNIVVTNTKNLTIEGITTAYAWGDCIYSHWWTNKRGQECPADSTQQMFHTYKNVSIIYGGRTGYGCELGDNVVFDSCYFYGNGKVRAKPTNSAVDVEPFNSNDTPKRYVMNYEFKNNVLKGNSNGIRLERCTNCSVHDNCIEDGASGVYVVSHQDVSYDITSASDRGWRKSRMSIYDNFIRNCSYGVLLCNASYKCTNVDIHDNTLVSCSYPFHMSETSSTGSGRYPEMVDSKIHDNITYGCGRWSLDKMTNCDIYKNRSYACAVPSVSSLYGGGQILLFTAVSRSSNTKFHHNTFSLDYGKSFYGLGSNGKEESYHGLPLGARQNGISGIDDMKPTQILFYENKISDDFYVYYGGGQLNRYFSNGINSIRNETSEVFIKGDTFRSLTYGDEGVVVSGGMMSCSWLANVRDFSEMESGDSVAYGEIIKSGSYYYTCDKAGDVGETLTGGTAHFVPDAVGSVPSSSSADDIKIVFKTKGVCTSETRPGYEGGADNFLYAGRRMWETDTKKEIVYDGTDWVYNDIYTEE